MNTSLVLKISALRAPVIWDGHGVAHLLELQQEERIRSRNIPVVDKIWTRCSHFELKDCHTVHQLSPFFRYDTFFSFGVVSRVCRVFVVFASLLRFSSIFVFLCINNDTKCLSCLALRHLFKLAHDFAHFRVRHGLELLRRKKLRCLWVLSCRLSLGSSLHLLRNLLFLLFHFLFPLFGFTVSLAPGCSRMTIGLGFFFGS